MKSCPNCGSPILHNYNYECPYCNTAIKLNDDKIKKLHNVSIKIEDVELRKNAESYSYSLILRGHSCPKFNYFEGSNFEEIVVSYEDLKPIGLIIEIPTELIIKFKCGNNEIIDFVISSLPPEFDNYIIIDRILEKLREIL